jgi:hypothetical protein
LLGPLVPWACDSRFPTAEAQARFHWNKPSTMRVLLYSHFSSNAEIDDYVVRSIENIAHNFHAIYFLTNIHKPVLHRDDIIPVSYQGAIDFESYIQFFRDHGDVISQTSRLYLVNDSILIQQRIEVPSSSRIDVFGLVESHQHGSHVQTFFIGFHGTETVKLAIDYLGRFPGSFTDKDAVVAYCEVGLGKFLIDRRMRVLTAYSAEQGWRGNPTQERWRDVLRDTGVLKHNHLLATGDYALLGVTLDEVLAEIPDRTWHGIVSRLYVRRRRPAVDHQAKQGSERDSLLHEIYGKILLRRCDASGLETYTRYLEHHSVEDLERTLRKSREYQVISMLADVYREVFNRNPDTFALKAYLGEVAREGGIESVKAILENSSEYRDHLEGTKLYRALCVKHCDRHAGYQTDLERDGSAEAVLIETRHEDALRYVLPGTLKYLPRGWGLTIFHSTRNEDFVRDICRTIGNVHFHRLPDSLDLADFRNYNRLLTDPAFWNLIDAEHVLIFQWDSLLTGQGIESFLGYDFIGAPWHNGRIGNGGFSLRNVKLMRDICVRHTPGDFENEDEFFSRHLYAEDHRIPDLDTARAFCSQYAEESLAYHRPWLSRSEAKLKALFSSSV